MCLGAHVARLEFCTDPPDVILVIGINDIRLLIEIINITSFVRPNQGRQPNFTLRLAWKSSPSARARICSTPLSYHKISRNQIDHFVIDLVLRTISIPSAFHLLVLDVDLSSSNPELSHFKFPLSKRSRIFFQRSTSSA